MSQDETAGWIVQGVAETVGSTLCVVFLTDEKEGNVLASLGLPAGEGESVFNAEMPLLGRLRELGSGFFAGDLMESPFFTVVPSALAVVSVACAPVVVGQKVIGFILAGWKERNHAGEGDALLLEVLAGQLALNLEVLRLRRQVTHLTVRDELTGCLNRPKFDEEIDVEISCAERYDRPLSLLLISVTPDDSSHQSLPLQDVVRKTGETLSYSIRMCDRLYRYHEETFAVLLPGIDKERALFAAKRLDKVIETTFEVEGKTAITVKMGVASFPSDGVYKNGLLKAAEAAVAVIRR